MARVAFPLVAQSPSTGSALVGATATVTQHVVGGPFGTGAPATIFLSETGSGTTSNNTIATDSAGRWTQGSGAGFAAYWLNEGTYDIAVTGTGLTSYQITRDLVAGSGAMPIGSVVQYAGAADPSGSWVIANARALSRSTYAAAFAVLGTTFGAGDGVSTFNIPDLRGRVAVGADSTGVHLPVNRPALGAGAGEENHTLLTAEMPSHNHNLGGSALELFAGGSWSFVSAGNAAIASGSTQSTGGGGSHNNLQPYLAVNHIIRVL